jgi:hypothetical protein
MLLYSTQVFLLKLSILAFYLRIFPGPGIRRLLWGTIIVTCIAMVVYNFVVIFQCQPVNFYWRGWAGEATGHCIGINAPAWANAASSIILDFWILGLPLFQLRHLRLHWKKKVGVALMFAVGTL